MFVCEGDLAAVLTLIQLKSHLFAEEAAATGWGGQRRGTERFSSAAQRSHLYYMDSPSVPSTLLLHLLFPQFTHVPASNKCLKHPPPTSCLSHKPKKKNKKDTQKLPLAALRTPRPGEWEGELWEEEQRRKGGGLSVCGNICAFNLTQVCSPPDVTDAKHHTEVKEVQELGEGKRLKLENLIYLIISLNN